MIFYANFSVIDDHTLVSTLFNNQAIPFFIMPEIGRYFPLDGFDLNIVARIFGVNAMYFYAFSATCGLIAIFALYKALKLVLDSSLYAKVLIILFLLTPAFITSFLRLFVPEKFESIFFGIFICFYILFLRKPKILYAIIALVCGSVALYYKEVAFIMLGGFAFFHFIFSFKNSRLGVKVLDIALMLSSFIWLVCYYIFVLSVKSTSGSYGDTPYNKLIVFAKNVLNYALSEPFLVLGLGSILLYRIYLVCFKKDSIKPFLDSALIASSLHMLAYFALNIYSFHYPLPAYIFALFPLGYYFRAYFKQPFIKGIFIISLSIYVLNSLPSFLYQLNHYKAVPNNYQETLSFLNSYLKEHPKTSLYLENVNRASNVEVYHSFAKNLEFLGNTSFDMKSDIGIDNTLLGAEKKDSKYSVFRSNAIVPKEAGDLVIVTPYGSKAFSKRDDYELMFEATNGFNMPLLSIKTIMKLALSKVLKGDSEIMLSSNAYALPIHFYVYRVR